MVVAVVGCQIDLLVSCLGIVLLVEDENRFVQCR
jgi:hypothetical protein